MKTARPLVLTSRHRQWRDLDGGRLIFGLCLGSMAMSAPLILFWILDATMAVEDINGAGMVVVIGGMAWCLIGGWTYLLVVSRWRRKIARIECLLLGLVLTDLVPLLTVYLVYAIAGEPGLEELFGQAELTGLKLFAMIAVLEAICAPIGLLNGWAFWRFGVRPSGSPERDVAAVFD